MAQVFLSYDREDGPKARVIAQALERAGHFVWWDLHIKGGAEYGKVIEQALEQADSVVVLWSARSVDSAWVRDEAAAGRDKGCLIPVLLEAVSPPMGFRQYQSLDFSSWKGRGKPPRLAELLDSIEGHARTAPDEPRTSKARASPSATPARRFPTWLIAGGVVTLVLVAVGLFVGLVLNTQRNSGVQTVAVTAVDAAARPLARDLLVNLGRLQSARSGILRLVNAAGRTELDSDLIFETATANENDKLGASLVLMDGKDRSILWSKDFGQESPKPADLNRQLAFTGARVLGCALEGLSYDGRALGQQTLKLYLNACADLAEQFGTNARTLLPVLRQITEEAPRFTPAWARLLLVQAEGVEANRALGHNPKAEEALRRSIDAALKHHPNLTEIKIAQLSLLPARAYRERMRLADDAIAKNPENPWVLAVRSNGLRSVGQTRASIEDAERAYQLDPLSPATLNSYISALAYSGRIDAAREKLAEAESLWPGTASLDDIRFRFHLRFGDPKVAREMARAGGAEPPLMMFLDARANPTKANIERYLTYTSHVQQNVPRAVRLAFVLQGWGAFDRVEDMYRQMQPWPKREELASLGDILFRPALRTFRQDPRFMRVAAHAGLLDYWRQSGKWPDFCFEPDLPYDCKAEAAKLG